MGISTSGDSPNVLRALETAKAMGLTTIGLTGKTGGKMLGLCDVCLCVPSNVTCTFSRRTWRWSTFSAPSGAAVFCGRRFDGA